jgi:hypothetical protein
MRPNIMSARPAKPKNHQRDQCIIVISACVPIPIIIGLELNYLNPIVSIFILAVATEYWFKDYNQQLAMYEKALIDARVKEAQVASRVNENIERYQRKQRERKMQAKSWQFWI